MWIVGVDASEDSDSTSSGLCIAVPRPILVHACHTAYWLAAK